MHLKGSCHCQAVRFELESEQAVPFMRCYCSICRKTNGAGGFAINLGGDHSSLVVHGEENISVYRALIRDASGNARPSSCERRFCRICGSGLWVYSPEWPKLVHPFAAAIDTELPQAPCHTHMMLDSKANWVLLVAGPKDRQFSAYPDESLAAWHDRMGL
jgi:hypothetical protein